MASPTPSLTDLLRRRDIWRLSARERVPGGDGVATGFGALDAVLTGGGWPRAALTELLTGTPASGELQLLLPALATIARQSLAQVWINPPLIPFAPALAAVGIGPASLLIVRAAPSQQLWACEQALRCAGCGAVLFWPAAPLRYAELRKLQVAAAAQTALAFLLRDTRAAAETSPAALRVQVQAMAEQQLSVRILKQRGAHAGQEVRLARPAPLWPQTPIAQRAVSVPVSALQAESPARRHVSVSHNMTVSRPAGDVRGNAS